MPGPRRSYRFRPYINKHGPDSFSFALRGIGTYISLTEADAKMVDITIAPVDDVPEIGETKSAGAYTLQLSSQPEHFFVGYAGWRLRQKTAQVQLKSGRV